jgi:heavy metal translocating P-type ATPase
MEKKGQSDEGPGDWVYRVDGMRCASCVGNVERVVGSVPGVESVVVDLLGGTVRVRPGAETDPGAVVNVLAGAGYVAERVVGEAWQDREALEEMADARRAFLRAALLAWPLLICELGTHFFHGSPLRLQEVHWLPWVLLALSTGIHVGPGRQFYIQGWAAFRRRVPDMNSLVLLGAGAAYLQAWAVLLLPGMKHGMLAGAGDSSGIVVTLVLLGRWMEAMARGKTGDAFRSLMDLQPKTAHVRRSGVFEAVNAAVLRVGDEFLVRPGERFPVDGEVLEGVSSMDRSLVTGESEPVWCGVGVRVLGGALNGHGGVVCRATQVGGATTLARIADLVRRARSTKLPVEAVVDRVTAVFVPVVLGVAGASFLGWFWSGGGLVAAWTHAASVLIVACPCAMGLAVPTSVIVASGRAARLGILFRKGEALQRLAGIRVLLFDKTGTLTSGHFQVVDVLPGPGVAGDWLLRCAASVEAFSEHPVAAALVRAAANRGIELGKISDLQAVPGRGVRGGWAEDEQERVLAGSLGFLRDSGVLGTEWAEGAEGAEAPLTEVHVAIGSRYLGRIRVGDEIRASAWDAVRALEGLGIRAAMVTGDRRRSANAVARALGIKEVRAELEPGAKMREVQAFGRFGPVAFVGDGINDGPALAAADVGIAMGGGTDVAAESAGVVLVCDDLRRLPDAVRLSRATVRNLRGNLAWAFGYNALLIPLAAGVFEPLWGLGLTPELSGLAMAFSSVSVLVNALRLRRFRPGEGKLRINRARRAKTVLPKRIGRL